MTASEKVAYIKGLIEGMELDTEKGQGKLLAAIADVLEDLALGLDELEAGLDAVSDDLEEVEEYVYDDYDEDYDEDEDYDDEDEDDGYDYSVVCPACGEEFLLENEDLDAGVIECPECGETLELDLSAEDEEEEEE